MSEVLTVRVDKELKEKLRKHNIAVGKTVRKALEKEVQKREAAQFKDDLEAMQRILRKIPEEEIVRAIRESRDSR